MTKDEELADKSFFNHDLSYKVTRDERSYKEGFVEGLKAGRDLTETDLATVAYMQGAGQQKKKSEAQLAKAKAIIKELLNVFVYDLADDELDSGDIDARTKAEEFLREVEK